MSTETKPVPNPGTHEARALGCICARMDNYNGQGVPWPRDDGRSADEFPSFWVTEGCPVHPAEWAMGRPDGLPASAGRAPTAGQKGGPA